MKPADLVPVGRISGLFGVHGWVKVFSYTSPRENILAYSPWFLTDGGAGRSVELVAGRRHGKGIVARLQGLTERSAAAALMGTEIAVRRAQLGPLAHGHYYWADLEGLRVVHRDGTVLGRVDHLIETGANDVLVVAGERERLVPFVVDRVILEVDVEGGLIRVDWEPEF